MTARQIWEGMLTELSKVNAPSMLLHDFNYFINKAINQYVNKKYNAYDINQQTTDDLRVLKASITLSPKRLAEWQGQDYSIGQAQIYGGTYEINLPHDYLHMLNCICIYELTKNHKCYNKGDHVPFAAKRLTSDSWSTIINDYYNRPLPWRPYYFIHNISNSVYPYSDRDMDGKYDVDAGITVSETGTTADSEVVGGKKGESGDSNFARTITLGKNTISTVERETAYRYGNAYANDTESAGVRCEIRYGKDDSIFKLTAVTIDYIKAPQVIRLTQEQVDLIEDTSQIMEYPDYVCQEIINELTMLVMENTGDPRLQSNIAVTQSIANPAQQQTPQPQPQQKTRQG